MTQQEEKVLKIIKDRLGITDETQDALIESYLYEIKYRILYYCQRSDIPAGLNWIWASMVIDLLRVDQPEKFGGGDTSGIDLKIGDTQIKPSSSSAATTTNKKVIDQIVLNYMADLHRWRKLKW